jgi:hypothetical protein
MGFLFRAHPFKRITGKIALGTSVQPSVTSQIHTDSACVRQILL